VAKRKQEYKETLLLGFITCNALNCKTLKTNLFKRGYYDVTQRGAYIGLNVYEMTPNGTYMGLNVYVIVVQIIK
jgi:hypothetical protein